MLWQNLQCWLTYVITTGNRFETCVFLLLCNATLARERVAGSWRTHFHTDLLTQDDAVFFAIFFVHAFDSITVSWINVCYLLHICRLSVYFLCVCEYGFPEEYVEHCTKKLQNSIFKTFPAFDFMETIWVPKIYTHEHYFPES